jgi:hypothetical protein
MRRTSSDWYSSPNDISVTVKHDNPDLREAVKTALLSNISTFNRYAEVESEIKSLTSAWFNKNGNVPWSYAVSPFNVSTTEMKRIADRLTSSKVDPQIIGLAGELEVDFYSRSPKVTFKGNAFYQVETTYSQEPGWGNSQWTTEQKTTVSTWRYSKPIEISVFNTDLESVWLNHIADTGKTASLERRADFYREVTPPDQLSSLTQGTPIGRSDNPDGTDAHSALPNGDSARNIGRPSPDSPNLKYRNLDKSEANGRTPANRLDLGYVHDSGSGSARVIPYDSGFANNGSALRKAGLIRPPQHLVKELTEIAKGALAEYLLDMEARNSSPYSSDDLDILEAFADDFAYLPKGIKRGEESLSDVSFQLKSGKNYLNTLSGKVTDSDDLSKIIDAHEIISRLNPQDLLEKVSLYKEDIRTLSDLFRDLFEGANGSGMSLINPYAKEKYEEAFQKNSHRRKVSRSGYSWRLSDPSLSHPLYVNVEFKSPLRAGGSYGFGNTAHIITFYFDSGKTTWGAFELDKIEDVARHELVHLMQKEIAIQRHLSKPNVSPREYRDTGLPRSRYDKTFRQPNIFDSDDVEDKKELLKSMRDQYRSEGLDPRLISVHALDDIEFYSRLLDEVTNFRKRNPQPKNRDIRAHLDRSQFFQSLKRYKPRNWKKAVGIFVDEVV